MRSITGIVIVAAVVTLCVATGNGQMARTNALQGVLADSLGNAKPEGPSRILFSLCDVGSGGSAVWSEEEIVNVSKGMPATYLGTRIPSGRECGSTGLCSSESL